MDGRRLDAEAGAMNVQQPPPADLIWHGEDDGIPLQDWLVEDILFKTGVALIAGQWGTYKTFIGVDLAASVMIKALFAGREVNHQGGVLWLAAEGQNQVRLRVTAVAREKVAPFSPAEDVTPINPEHMPFTWMSRCPRLTDPNAIVELRRIIAAAAAGMKERFNLPLVLVVIDAMTSAALFKDAGASAEAAQVMDTLNKLAHEFGLLIAVIDHFGKDVSTGTRDSSVKEDLSDSILALLADRALNGTVTSPRMALRKVRGGSNGEEIPFTPRQVEVPIDGKPKPFTTMIIDWTQPAAAAAPSSRPWPKTLIIFKQALDVMLLDCGELKRPFHDGPEVRAVKRLIVEAEFLKAYSAPTLKAKKTAFVRCVKRAQEEMLMICREIGGEEYYWRPDVK
jgi:hypothetical protein